MNREIGCLGQRFNFNTVRGLSFIGYYCHIQENGVFFMKSLSPKHKPALSPRLTDLLKRYNMHRKPPSILEPSTEDLQTLSSYAHFIRKNKIGSCRQRVIAAYEELQADYSHHVRAMDNEVHNVLEIKENDYWHRLDLGGYEANLLEKPLPKIWDTYNVEKLNQEEKIEQKNTAAPANNQLICINIDEELQQLYKELLKNHKPADIFVTHQPEELSLSAEGFTIQGQILLDYTRLSQWLKNRKQGLIVVDLRHFNLTEIAQLNDLLDRKIEKHEIPQEIDVLLINYPECDYDPSFTRRVSPSTLSLTPQESPLLEEKIPASSLTTAVKEKEIDLFNSGYWQTLLLGSWQLYKKPGSSRFSFKWQEGELLAELTEEKSSSAQIETHITLKNPPLHDASFRLFLEKMKTLRQIEWVDQKLILGDQVHFYQNHGLDWPALAKQASLEIAEETKEAPEVLSNANILSFIKDPCYEFSRPSLELEDQPCYLRRAKKQGQPLRIFCTPDLKEDSLAHLLTEAKKQGVFIQFVLPGADALLENSALHYLGLSIGQREKSSAPHRAAAVEWLLAEDIYFKTQQLITDHPKAAHFDFNALIPPELGYFPIFPADFKTQLLEHNAYSLNSSFSSILKKLEAGETVILSGKIKPELYEALSKLAFGFIEGKPFSGKLIIVASTDNAKEVQALSGQKITPHKESLADKVKLLHKRYPGTAILSFIRETIEYLALTPFARIEQAFLKRELQKKIQSLGKTPENKLSDEECAQKIDEYRLHQVIEGLALSPWVMLEGPTGIAKSYFLKHILPQAERTQVDFNLEKWLTSTPQPNEQAVLAFDEANLLTQLGEEGPDFLERFKGLRDHPPHFLWKGQDYILTPRHKAVFAFNPAHYGAGRQNTGFLTEHALRVFFHALPGFYIHARLIKPLFRKTLKNKQLNINLLAGPLLEIYRWICQNSRSNEVLITPRQIKAMINLIASQVNYNPIQDAQSLHRLAREVAYTLTKENLKDHPLLPAFIDNFQPTQDTVNHTTRASAYLPYQTKAYQLLRRFLEARRTLSETHRDLGLGGILLEGESNIGKTTFVNQVVQEYCQQYPNTRVYRISATTPFATKESILRQAYKEGALVIADEINTSHWPNELLNNFLMGENEKGKEHEEVKPGFMLIATQNPAASSIGRSKEDPARLHRMLKLKLDWPRYNPQMKKNLQFFKAPRKAPVNTVEEKRVHRHNI